MSGTWDGENEKGAVPGALSLDRACYYKAFTPTWNEPA